MTDAELRAALSSGELVKADAFAIAAELSRRISFEPEGANHDLLLRALDIKDAFGPSGVIIEGLTRLVGLFPYLHPDDMSVADQIAYELHRPDGMEESDVVFHRVQNEVYRELMDGRSVVLSAPTSFGKSLLIDAMIASRRFKKIVVVVPTIALIDETRRRLSRFGDQYKVITHPNQAPGERSVYVLTQERVVEGLDVEGVDFFVIDEFYKLDPSSRDDRSAILNHALYRLMQTGAQFYMLGPNIRGIPEGFGDRYRCTFIRTDYQTVASETTRIAASGKDELLARLVALVEELKEPTLIYCSSPARVRLVVRALIESGAGEASPSLGAAVDWIGQNYHPDWLFPRGLARGIAYHHGRLPRALSELAVRSFNDGAARVLVCTSTLIEGVNTKAKNVVVFDNKIARRKFDFFTFNNIVGRSGRMFEHFVGHIYLFHDAPSEQLPMIDIPAFTQSDEAPEMLLLQMDETDWTERSRSRLSSVLDQKVLPASLLRENHGINPDHQVELARTIRENLEEYLPDLQWWGLPTYQQLKTCCELIHDHFVRSRQRRHGVSSPAQLTFLINRFIRERSVRAVIDDELSNNRERKPEDADTVVEAVLDFVRYWASYNFPKYLRALHRIQDHILSEAGVRPGDYTVLATQVENFFLDPAVFALDEYGIPIEVGRKIQDVLAPDGDLDVALRRLRALDMSALDLTAFERQLIRDAMAYV